MGDKSKYETDIKLYHHKLDDQYLQMPAKNYPPECLDEFRDFQFRDGDILCATYPKMGEL